MIRKFLTLAACLLAGSFAHAQADVLVQRGADSRIAANLSETTLSSSNVAAATFGKLYSFAVDGYVYAQPLYKSNVTIPGKGTFNVVFVATEHGSVFAFDADSATPLWQASFINLAAGITPQPSADTGTTDIVPEVSITSTPVIDATSGTLYVVAKTKENGSAVYRLHALDITTGANKVSPVVIQASVAKTGGSGGTLSFNANDQQQRPGLVVLNGVVYVAFGSSGDAFPWAGWILGYNSSTLAQVTILCTSTSGQGAGLWAAGEAPPIDANGNLYFSTGNGAFDGAHDWGNSYLKLATAGGLSVADYFAPFNQSALNASDLDIATAGPILLPDSAGTTAHPHLMIASGKNGTIYVLDRDNLGHYDGSYTNADNRIVQWIANAVGVINTDPKQSPQPYVENNYTTPGFWQNHVYFCGINDHCKMFNLSNGLLTTSPVSQSAATFAFGGAQPVVTAASASATSAIMWAVERDTNNNISTLHAYDATDLTKELYNSNQAANKRDQGGAPVKFVIPTVSNGKVFFGAQSEIDTYGILASNPTRLAAPTFSPTPRAYSTPQTVTLTAASGATIYYTLDGSLPTLSSNVYSGPITVNTTTTIQAIAVESGFFTSPVAVATYTIGSVTPAFVQGNYADPQSPQASVSVTYSKAQSAGNLNVVVVGWNDSTATVKSVTDISGNNYKLAIGPTVQSGTASQAIYYASNIASAAASGNTVTVTFNGSAAFPDIRVLEYSGLDPSSPLDVSIANMGNGTSSSSGSITTTFANDLIFGANTIQSTTTGAGAGFTSRMITTPDADIAEDEVVSATGSYAATAPQTSGLWIMQMVAFKSGSVVAPVPSAPTTLTAAAVSSSEIDLTWGASTESGGTITQYLIERCAGTGCTNFTQVATSTTTSFNDTGLAASTTYIYRVRAVDNSGTQSSYSNTATAATVAANAPSAPTNLALAPQGDSEIDLSWTAATAQVGSISQYLIESCSGLGCSNFVQIGTSTTTTFNNTGLTPVTSYSYRVRAVDTSNTPGPYSSIATVRTRAQVLPTAPTNLTATASGTAQINLSWGASGETGGTISQYLIERCTGASCTNFVQVATSATTTYSDTGLASSTTYSYQVRAQDNTGHDGPYSNTASATTSGPTFTAPSNLAATAASSSQISLTWTAATETGGTISGYLVERCQGTGCSTFTQIATATGTSYNDTGLTASTTYSYRVRATDAASNVSGYSNIASATTSSGSTPPPITFVQSNSADPQSSPTSVSVKFTAAQGAGDLNIVVVGWNNSTATVGNVTDSSGNVYAVAVGPTVQSGVATQTIYYAKNIVAAAANANTVTVTFNGAAAFPDIRIVEYSGIDTTSPLDVTAAASGSSATSSSGSATTTVANELIFGANLVQTGTTAAGSGFTKRVITVPDADIAEDRIVSATGSYSATAPVSPSGQWIMQMATFKRHP